MDSQSKKKSSPFGLEFLQPLPEEELAKVNGGLRFHTDFISLPSKRYPKGDHG